VDNGNQHLCIDKKAAMLLGLGFCAQNSPMNFTDNKTPGNNFSEEYPHSKKNLSIGDGNHHYRHYLRPQVPTILRGLG
jgi:hypothetical protein